MTSRLRLTLVLGTLAALGPLSIDMYLPSFPSLARSLGTSVAAVQLTLATYVAGLALGQLVHGPLSDRYGRRPPLFAGLLLYGVAALACALAPTLPVLAAARFVQGLGGCAGIVVSRAVVRDHCDEREAAGLFSSLILVMGAAPILAPLLGAQLLGWVGWRGIFVLLAAIAGALAGMIALALPESLPPAARRRHGLGETLRGFGTVLRQPRFVRLTLAGGAGQAALFAYITGSPFVFIERFGVPAERFGLIFGANAVGLIAASQVNRFVVREVGVTRALRGGIVGALTACAALAIAVRLDAGLAAVLPAVFGAVSAVGFVMPNATAGAMSGFGAQAGSASAVMGVLQSACGAAAAVAVSALADGTAAPMASVMLACAVAALGLVMLETRAEAQASPAS